MACSDTTTSPVQIPLDGSVLLSETIDFHLDNNPTLPVYAYSEDDTSLTEITHLEFARAAHRVAHALRPNRCGSDGQVVAIIAVTDTILYQTITMGLLRAGLVPFPISSRNSTAAVTNLLQGTSCHRIIATSAPLHDLLDDVKSHLALVAPNFDLVIDEIPPLEQIYPKLGAETANDPFEPYPTWQTRPRLNDVMMYLHSSGSTGLPKAVPISHLIMAEWFGPDGIPGLQGYSPPLRMAGMVVPPFHLFGVSVQISCIMFALTSCSVFPPTSSKGTQPPIPSPDIILEHVRRTKTNVIMTVPTFLEVWAQSQEAIELLKTMEYVTYAGGPLPTKIGDNLIEAGVTLHSAYGGTEFGAATYILPDKRFLRDWAWMRLLESLAKRWISQGDGTYELQLLTSEKRHYCVENLPDVKGYATSDLFIKHPTKEGLWRIVGRLDDVIVLTTGEKTVPVPMEDLINPHVQGALMFGHQRSQVGILIEPRQEDLIDPTNAEQVAIFRNKIWPFIEQANKDAPAFSRIFKEMILIASPSKPIVRVAKGTVMRKATLKVYEEEIQQLYETVEQSAQASETIAPPRSWTEDDLVAWLAQHVTDIQAGEEVSPDEDLFQQGFDSLSATFLRNRIINALRSSTNYAVQRASRGVSQDIVYANPSLVRLAGCISGIVKDTDSGEVGTSERKKIIENMVEKYTVEARASVSKNIGKGRGEGDAVVLLTGSTGSLGSHILELLLQDKAIRRIYALNRPSSDNLTGIQRHKTRFEDAGLDIGLLALEKLILVEADAAQDHLGLDIALYEELRCSTTVIIHNAWRLDFNLSLPSFESNIRGTRNLIDLALASPNASILRFIFTSSVATAQSWNTAEKGAFPEEVQDDPGCAMGTGYGESKYVAEQLLARSGLQGSSLRIGQICGGIPNGAWPTTDWVPIIVKSSLGLGALPDIPGPMSWLPTNAVSRVVLDIAFADGELPPALNVVHPRPVSWVSLIQPVRASLVRENIIKPSALPIIPYEEWVDRLEDRAKNASPEDLRNIPALKLSGFYRRLTKARGPEYSTKKVQAVSSTMAELKPIGAQDAELWARYWNARGLFKFE